MNSPLILGVLLASAATTIATVLGWVMAAAAWHLLRRRSLTEYDARLLVWARLLPLVSVVLLVPAQISAFIRYEAGLVESAGPLLLGLAVPGLVWALDALGSGMTVWLQTCVAVSRWQREGRPLAFDGWPYAAWVIVSSFPIAGVTGFLRPRLFIDRRIVHACTDAELAAILAHEAEHVARRDYLIQLLFYFTPGARGFRRLASPIEAAWKHACEEAADRAAVRKGLRLALATALVKLAGLVVAGAPESIAASTLIDAPDLKTRISRVLLSRPTTERRLRRAWLVPAALVAAGLILQSAPLSARLHELFELLVRHG